MREEARISALKTVLCRYSYVLVEEKRRRKDCREGGQRKCISSGKKEPSVLQHRTSFLHVSLLCSDCPLHTKQISLHTDCSRHRSRATQEELPPCCRIPTTYSSACMCVCVSLSLCAPLSLSVSFSLYLSLSICIYVYIHNTVYRCVCVYVCM